MQGLSNLIYRMYFGAKKMRVGTRLRRWPGLVRSLRRCRVLFEDYAFTNEPVWVRARAGLSKGLWMRLRLPEEARYWRGDHERNVQDVIRSSVRPCNVAYDVGSHVGSLALGMARLVGKSGKVVAFEADPENAADLRESRVRNHLEASLEIVQAAVWSNSAGDNIPFRRGGVRRSEGGVEVEGQNPVVGTGEIVNVRSITLDEFIASGGPAPQLVKIDVEGGEYEVLRGGSILFTRQKPILIVEVHHQMALEQITAWLGEHEYYGKWDIPKEKFPRCLFAWPGEVNEGTA